MSVVVGIVEAAEIFRRGLIASLEEDDKIEVAFAVAEAPPHEHVDVLIVGAEAVDTADSDCALVVCGAPSGARERRRRQVAARLVRDGLTAAQLVASVHAAAAGLRVTAPDAEVDREQLDARRREVLRLLAQGADTRTIAGALSYSERTVKGVIHDLVRDLHAENRAHAVAVGIRSGLI